MSNQNSELICRGYEAFGRGDVAAVMTILSPDITWHVPGRGPLSGDYHGHDEVAKFFAETMRLSQGSFSIQLDELLAANDTVVALCTVSAERNGRTWSSTEVHLWHITEGRATRFREYQGDQQAEDEFWSM